MANREEIDGLCKSLVRGLVAVLGDKMYGAYVYGAAAFPDAAPTGDIDFHVILRGTVTATEKAGIEALHAALARDFPPLGAELDGYYLLLDDARRPTPPAHQLLPGVVDSSWALHREHIRAGRCIALHGPDPKDIYPAASWAELEVALLGELRYVEDHLLKYPDYCILNLCRLIYSFATRDVVVSKAQAAAWAWERLPKWRKYIDLARESYPGQATPEVRQQMLDEVVRLYAFACQRIAESQAAGITKGAQ